MDTLLCAYLAGVLDSDGSIFLARRSSDHGRSTGPTYHLCVAVTQASNEAVALFAQTFGGKAFLRQPMERTTYRMKKPLWAWVAYTRSAAECLHTLAPYIRIKRRQLEIAQEFLRSLGPEAYQRHVSGKPLRPEVRLLRCRLWEGMRGANIASGKGHVRPHNLRLSI